MFNQDRIDLIAELRVSLEVLEEVKYLGEPTWIPDEEVAHQELLDLQLSSD